MLQEYVRMFQLFESYVAISVFMLQVASVLSSYCICFTHILKVYVSNVNLLHTYVAFKSLMLQVFHVSEVCLESLGAWPDRRWMGRAVRLGSYGHGVFILILAPGPACAEREEGIRGKEQRARGGARRMGAGYACRADKTDVDEHASAAANGRAASVGGLATYPI